MGKMKDIKRKISLKSALPFLILLILTGFVSIWKFAIGALLMVFFETALILWKAKYSFISVFAFLVNYCFLMEYFAYSRRYVYGILGLGYVDIYYFEMFLCCSILNLVVLLFIDRLDIAGREREIYKTGFRMAVGATKMYCALAVGITLLIFPSLPGHFDQADRFSQGILPFRGWSGIPFFFTAVSILGRQRRKTVFACALFIIFWYVSHGERVEAMGLIIFVAIWLLNTVDFSVLKKAVIMAAGGTAVFMLTIVGIIRTGHDATIAGVLTNIFVQTTACDVTNVFNCAVDFYIKHGGYHGETYLSYLINCIPYLNDPYTFSIQIIKSGYRSAGGAVFLAEPFANGGIAVVLLETLILAGCFYWLVKKASVYRAMIYVELFVSVFRIAWYGLRYPIVPILYFVPFAFLINKVFLREKIVIRLKRRRSVRYLS